MVQRAFQQSPRPDKVKLGRLALPYTQVAKFGVVAGGAVNATVYGFTMQLDAVSVDITYTSDSSATIAEIVAGLAAAVEASSLGASVVAVAADTNTTCSITAGTAGKIVYYSAWDSNKLTFKDVTPDPGIATDMAAIRLADADFYGVTVDEQSEAILAALDGWAETQDVLSAGDTSDSRAFDSSDSTDIGKVLKLASAGRMLCYFSLASTASYTGVGGLAERFPHDVDAAGAGGTFHGKTIVGVAADPLTPTQLANLRAKNYVTYTTTANRNHTLDGMVAGGEFADKVRGLDWFRLTLETNIAAAILNNDKIAYDDKGISIIFNEMLSLGKRAEDNELFTPGTFSASAPKAASVSPTNKALRKLTGLVFSAQLAGAIHLAEVTGVVTD
jgi:hypothetical protein